MVSMLLGEYEIPDLSVPPLHLPTLPLLSRLLEGISGTLDLLMDLAHIAFLDSALGLTPLILSLPSPGMSVGSMIALPLVSSFAPPAATIQLLVPTVALPISPLRTSLSDKMAIPVSQAALSFKTALPAILP